MSNSMQIAIFARAPIPGAAKTRLIPRLGSEGAAALHARLVLRTVRAAVTSGVGPVMLWCTPDTQHPLFEELREGYAAGVTAQPTGDLGARMSAAFRVHEPEPLLLIGTDCPVLGPDQLRRAATELRNGTDAVFLPAEDGGYALVGLQRPLPLIFQNMPWGTELVMAETRRRLSAMGVIWTEPELVWDVDRPEDVDRLYASGLLGD